MVSNLYADLDAFRRRYVDKQVLDAGDATEVLQMLKTVSRDVDNYLNRRVFAEERTIPFDGNGLDYMDLPDLLAQTSVKLDEDTDGTYELTLVLDTDFWLQREGHFDLTAKPFNTIRLNPFKGVRSRFYLRPKVLEIVGTWGFSDAVEVVDGVTADLTDATTTAMTTNKRGALAVGQTVLIGTEQLYISDLVRGGGGKPKWTVQRGVNGTTAASHSGAAVSRYVYIPEVVDAVMIQAGRKWKRRETAYASMVVNPAVGTIEVFKGLDPDVKLALDPYRRLSW